MKRAAVAMFCGLVLGCGAASDANRSTRSDSAGISVVTSPGEDRLLGWTLTEDLTIGADEDSLAFYRILPPGLDIDERGRIYVADTGNRRVLVFDRAGGLLRAIGRPGSGPGEFNLPVSLAADEDGRVLVSDVGHRRLMFFDSAGRFMEDRPYPRGHFGRQVRIRGDTITLSANRTGEDGASSYVHVLSVAPSDTVELWRAPLAQDTSIVYESCGISLSLPPFFAEPPVWDAAGGLVAAAAPPDYQVVVYEQGAARSIIRRAIEAPPATEEHVAAELGEGEKWTIGSGRECVVPVEEVIENRGVAEKVPLIENVALSADGAVWVLRREFPTLAQRIDVFDPAGGYLGTLPPGWPWPDRFTSEGAFLSIEEDSLGVQRIVRYRVERN